MNFTVAYKGRSGVSRAIGSMALSFAPNLRRDRVSFVGELRDPLRFREAVSALHAVVVSDLKFKPKDKSAYQAYLKRVQEREQAIRQLAYKSTKEQLLAVEPEPIPPGLERQFHSLRETYWGARLSYSDYLCRNDPALWRVLVPCDPVITVAPDVLFFECFSKDESSYGCLSVDREWFTTSGEVALGTTNVDYSLTLYEEFQRLRTYRRTRFAVDPAGFEVATEGAADYREEKIDLPPSWLRGFMQLQAAMSLPLRRVPISREGLYAILAHLKRHRAAPARGLCGSSCRPAQPVRVVLEPWELAVTMHEACIRGRRRKHSASGAATDCSRWPVCCRWLRGPTCSSWALACRPSGRCDWQGCGSCWGCRVGRRTTGPAAAARWPTWPRRSSRAKTFWATSPPPSSGPRL